MRQSTVAHTTTERTRLVYRLCKNSMARDRNGPERGRFRVPPFLRGRSGRTKLASFRTVDEQGSGVGDQGSGGRRLPFGSRTPPPKPSSSPVQTNPIRPPPPPARHPGLVETQNLASLHLTIPIRRFRCPNRSLILCRFHHISRHSRTTDNSPPVQRWVKRATDQESPARDERAPGMVFALGTTRTRLGPATMFFRRYGAWDCLESLYPPLNRWAIIYRLAGTISSHVMLRLCEELDAPAHVGWRERPSRKKWRLVDKVHQGEPHGH
jgi:hypothetical protein